MAQILSDGRKLGVNGSAHLHKVLLSNDKRLKNLYGIGKEEIIRKEDRHQNLSNLGLNSNDGQLIIIGFRYSISLIYSKKKKKKRNVIFLQFGLGANSCLLIRTKTARITTKKWVFIIFFSGRHFFRRRCC